jgi:FimV-like protein
MITSRQNTHAFKITLSALVVFLVVSLLMVETLSAETRYRVKSSDNVNTIVERYYPNSDLSRGQLLVGILIKNPRAFKGGNINFLLRGKRLTLPDESDIQKVSPDKASELLSEHARFFRFGLAGNLPTPTFSEMESDPEEFNGSNNRSNDILLKQKSQTKKIDQLQLESNDLKKQLETLLYEKSNRDVRLLELEKSLKESLTVDKQANTPDNSVQLELKKSNKLLQQALSKTKSELAEKSKSNIELKSEVESFQDIMGDNDTTTKMPNDVAKVVIENKIEGRSDKIILEPSTNILLKLVWLLPLILLALFLYYFFGKNRHARQDDDTVKVNEAGYIDSYESNITEFQDNVAEEPEESSLETSVKLDVARAYIEAEDTQSALDILTEIMEEGSDEQRQQAHDLLETISSS